MFHREGFRTTARPEQSSSSQHVVISLRSALPSSLLAAKPVSYYSLRVGEEGKAVETWRWEYDIPRVSPARW